MNPIEIARKNGQNALSEYQSKQYLGTFGIPVTREKLVRTAEEAIAASQSIGFPVALKACSPNLLHKSEADAIALGLASSQAVERAFHHISRKVQMDLDGILIQEMITGSRELVVGMTRDPQFGPCVMLGFGGVMAEVIQDTVFRVAPFDTIEAMDMINELKSKKLLGPFRGQQPADLDTLCRILTSMGELGLQQASIAEIDINPLIVSPDGQIKAVDALIILEDNRNP